MKATHRLALATIAAAMLVLFLAQMAGAAGLAAYSADYSILNSGASVKVTVTLDSKVSEFEWSLPEDAADVAVEGLSFEVVDLKSFKRLQAGGQPFDTIVFSYSTSSVLEKTRNSFFILDLAGIGAARKSVTVRLPAEATLKYSLDSPQASVIPRAGSVRTDGKRIIISWNETSLVNGEAILVIYEEAGKFNTAVAVAAAGIMLLAGATIAFYRRRKAGAAAVPGVTAEKEKTTHSDLTRNLFEDEKKIVELLLTAGEEGMWQKQLEIKSGISKVKLSRKLRSIEQKGLVEKIPYGNANKIRLKKA
ncbi:hypothetical protein HYU40_04975 [Candidatus Woesearchaeota archaeon]|nr:hypothetical protein [Candidatus Woesearchaeota archaeon]